MFNFRVINATDGTQIIDRNLKTPDEALTPIQMMEYIEIDNNLSYMDMLERKKRKEEQKKQSFASVLAHAMGL